MEVNEHELRLTTLGCFRYSLGRMTYMPSHTIDFITEHHKIFREHDWETFVKEIEEYDSDDRLGMKCDKERWLEFRDYCKDRIDDHNSTVV